MPVHCWSIAHFSTRKGVGVENITAMPSSALTKLLMHGWPVAKHLVYNSMKGFEEMRKAGISQNAK